MAPMELTPTILWSGVLPSGFPQTTQLFELALPDGPRFELQTFTATTTVNWSWTIHVPTPDSTELVEEEDLPEEEWSYLREYAIQLDWYGDPALPGGALDRQAALEDCLTDGHFCDPLTATVIAQELNGLMGSAEETYADLFRLLSPARRTQPGMPKGFHAQTPQGRRLRVQYLEKLMADEVKRWNELFTRSLVGSHP